MSKAKKIIILILCLIGLGLSLELCNVYYHANFAQSAAPSICAINDAFDCDSVAKTSYSQFLGIPLALWGILLYLFVLFMLFVDKLQNLKFLGFLKVFKNPLSYIFCISLLSFCISMVLGCISIFKINSVCIFCFMTYFIDLLIALTAKDWKGGIFKELKDSIFDFYEAIKVRRYAFWFIMLVLLAASILTYTTISNILAPQEAKRQELLKTIGEVRKYVNGNELGKTDADLIIHEYMDFNCGGCFIANIYLQRIVKEFENVKVIQHNIPLDITCNHNMKFSGHKNSCLKAYYAHAAAKQNKYWEMSDLIFGENPQTEKEIIEKARLLDFDIKKLKEDANSEEIKQEVKDSIAEADTKKIEGTPTMFIGIKQIVGVDSYPDFKQIVIEQGGREKANNE